MAEREYLRKVPPSFPSGMRYRPCGEGRVAAFWIVENMLVLAICALEVARNLSSGVPRKTVHGSMFHQTQLEKGTLSQVSS